MSLSQTMPPNYQSVLYPSSGSGSGAVLPAVHANGTGGNAVDYMSKAVGGRRHRRHRTIIRRRSSSSRRRWRSAGRKTRKISRGRRTH